MRNSVYLILLLALVGCKSPAYVAQTKSELAKLCVYEFPPSNVPIKVERDTITIHHTTIVRDSVDCTDKVGIQYIDRYLPSDTIKYYEKIYLPDASQDWYIKDLEFQLEKTNEHNKELLADFKSLTKKYKRNITIGGFLLIILVAFGIYRFLK